MMMWFGYGFIPLLLFYVLPIAFVIWAILTFIKLQKQKVELMKELVSKLDTIDLTGKEVNPTKDETQDTIS
ncbi:hypothetical protein [Bacillus massilinigeriensis]|uniref:hypothetical protein n=1 Tax=Bacillus mediterraneensis TaxID=1805474 RepID=UPI0008F91A40|nr:hypothetical protein [Bacillus mediterraneensis]